MAHVEGLTDEDRIRWDAFRQGDETAFVRIARDHYKSLFGYGKKFSRDREFIKDCIQDLFLELWARKESLGETRFIRFYLLKSLRRKMLRENSRKLAAVNDQEPDIETGSVEEQLIELETNEALLKALNRQLSLLTRRQHEIIHLKFFENLDNEAIAEVMSISRQAVANLLYRALRDLREKL